MEYFLFFGIVLIAVVAMVRWDNYWCSKTPYVRPKAPPCPEKEGSSIHIKFPDGLEGNIYKYLFSQMLDKYITTEWTPPMKELFLLITQDYGNWEVSYSKYSQRWVHKNLGVVIDSHGHYLIGEYGCNLSMTRDQSSCVVGYAKCWREVKYGAKINRITRIKACRYDRIRLETAQKEAKMITDYLESK